MLKWLVALLLSLSSFGVVAGLGDPLEVVSHMSEGVERAPQAIRNIRNHLNADPKAMPSGVAEVARLQSQEGYSYLKR